MTKASWVLAAFLLAAAPAAAHITVGAEPVASPVTVGQPFDITVLFSEPCFEMPVEVASGNDELTAALDATAPAYAKSTAAETVPWSIDGCEPSTSPTDFGGQVRQAAKLTVVVDASAPGLTNISIPVNYVDANGGSGGAANVNITVAYFANGTLKAAEGQASHADGQHSGHVVALTLDYATNADSVLTFEATGSVGNVTVPASQDVAPPSVDNKSVAQATATLAFEPPADWTAADLSIKAFLTPKAGGAKVPVGTATLQLTNDEADEHGDHEHEDEASKDTPAPAFALVGLALLAFAARRR